MQNEWDRWIFFDASDTYLLVSHILRKKGKITAWDYRKRVNKKKKKP